MHALVKPVCFSCILFFYTLSNFSNKFVNASIFVNATTPTEVKFTIHILKNMTIVKC